MVPADIRIVDLNSITFVVDESILTGEPYKNKDDTPIKKGKHLDI